MACSYEILRREEGALEARRRTGTWANGAAQGGGGAGQASVEAAWESVEGDLW